MPNSNDDLDFETTVRQQLEERAEILEYEITDSSPKHVLAAVVQQYEDTEPEDVLYRIEYEPRPEGGYDINWRNLGTID